VSENNATNEQMMEMIKSLQSQHQEGGGWKKKQAATGNTEVKGVSIPISIETDNGKIRVYLHFDGSVASSPESLFALIEKLDSDGIPLDIWQGKKTGKWNNKRGW
jgi:hypothetical protein